MSAKLMKSKLFRRPSVNLWHQLFLNLLQGLHSNFGSCFAWAIFPDNFFFFFFLFVLFCFFTNVFRFGYHGTLWEQKFQNATPPSNHFWIFSIFFSEFSSRWSSHKYCFALLKFWVYDFSRLFFSLSLTWDPIGAKTSKCYSYLKSLSNLFKPFPKFWVSDF